MFAFEFFQPAERIQQLCISQCIDSICLYKKVIFVHESSRKAVKAVFALDTHDWDGQIVYNNLYM